MFSKLHISALGSNMQQHPLISLSCLEIFITFFNSKIPINFACKGPFPGPPCVFLYSSDHTKVLNSTVLLPFT